MKECTDNVGFCDRPEPRHCAMKYSSCSVPPQATKSGIVARCWNTYAVFSVYYITCDLLCHISALNQSSLHVWQGWLVTSSNFQKKWPRNLSLHSLTNMFRYTSDEPVAESDDHDAISQAQTDHVNMHWQCGTPQSMIGQERLSNSIRLRK